MFTDIIDFAETLFDCVKTLHQDLFLKTLRVPLKNGKENGS